MGPERRIRSPGRTVEAPNVRPGMGVPSPVVVRYIRSSFPCSTTLVSPPTIGTPAAWAARANARTSDANTSLGSPDSRMKVTTSATARAPATARSFTVPFTASSPMEPPGKTSGVTTKPSVGDRHPGFAQRHQGGVAELGDARRGRGAEQRGRRSAGGSPCPPAPWAISIRDSRKRTAGAGVTSAGALTRSPPGGPRARPSSDARSCSRPRTSPPTTPSARRPDAPACTPCRTACIAPA